MSDVIKTNTGYSIYKCTGDKVASNIEESATVDAVKKYITTNKQSMIEDYFMEKAKTFVASAKLDGFETAASKANVEVTSVPAFPLNYGDISLADKIDSTSAQAFANASSNKDFLEKAFAMKEKEISEPMLLGNYITVFQLKEIQKTDSDEGRAAKVAEEVLNYDQNSAQSTLLASSKIVNNVADVYFNKFMSK